MSTALTRSDLTAIAIALDELLSYHAAVGNVDDDEYREYETHAWAIRKLQTLLEHHRFEVAP